VTTAAFGDQAVEFFALGDLPPEQVLGAVTADAVPTRIERFEGGGPGVFASAWPSVGDGCRPGTRRRTCFSGSVRDISRDASSNHHPAGPLLWLGLASSRSFCLCLAQ
jgi:hypothetical protein